MSFMKTDWALIVLPDLQFSLSLYLSVMHMITADDVSMAFAMQSKVSPPKRKQQQQNNNKQTNERKKKDGIVEP